jgi:DNA mismatch endonuclease Vsr
MSKIRSRNTVPELKLRRALRKLGFIYQPKHIFGKPDFANKKSKIAVFIDGCFWHGCPYHYITPKTNSAFWSQKIKKNIARDRKVGKTLKKEGYKVFRYWEHTVERNPDKILLTLSHAVQK